jgi:hypothetical protein
MKSAYTMGNLHSSVQPNPKRKSYTINTRFESLSILLLLPLALHPWVGLDLLESLRIRITKLCPSKFVSTFCNLRSPPFRDITQ